MRRAVLMAMMMMSGALAAAASPESAPAMTVEQFLSKVAALKAAGRAAMDSPDLALVRAEINAAGTAYRAEIEAAKAAGQAPRSCPPPRGQVTIGADALIGSFRKLPPDQRRMSVKDAFYGAMDKRFPCS